MTWKNAGEEFLLGTDPGMPSVTDPVMVLWRDAAMTTHHCHRGGAGPTDAVQLGLFESEDTELCPFVHPRHRRFAALLLRAAGDENAALEVLSLLEPELGVLARRLVRLAIEPDVAQGEALSVAWEVVAGHRLGPLLPTKACLTTVIWTELRREFGVRRYRRIELVPLTDEIDIAAPGVDPAEPWPGLLDAAIAGGVITRNQAIVVAQTRVEGRGLAEVARDLGRPYDAVQKDRRRAEQALATFARSYYAEESR
jgi:DNA-directed RNA polymerase specialized sigma24 family protein